MTYWYEVHKGAHESLREFWSSNALAVVGCIPTIPGAVAARAIPGLFAVTAQAPAASGDAFLAALENALRVALTIGSRDRSGDSHPADARAMDDVGGPIPPWRPARDEWDAAPDRCT